MNNASHDSPSDSAAGHKGLLLVGMHRSGTSALARVVNLLGVPIGRKLVPSGEDNPRGFWELEEIVEVHNDLLEQLGSAWDDPLPLPDDWKNGEHAMAARERIGEILNENFALGDAMPFAIKDPRLSRLLPLWKQVLAELGVDPYVILIHRHPMEVAQSLAKRNEMRIGRGLLLWLRYVLDAERETRGIPRAFLSYASLLGDWRGEMQRIGSQLGVSWPIAFADAAVDIDAFLAAGLRHHTQPDEIMDNTGHGPLLDGVYAAIQQSHPGNEDDLQVVCDETNRELAKAGTYYADTISDEAARTRKLRMLVDTYSEQYSSLEDHYHSVEKNFHSLEDAYRALEKHHLAIQEQNKHLTEEIWKQRDAQLKLEALLAETQAELTKTKSELWKTKAELTTVQTQLEAIYQSTSWQITKPLRSGASLLKNLKSK